MNKNTNLFLTCWVVIVFVLCFFSPAAQAQPCTPPAKQVVLYDPAGNYYVYWKPVTPPAVINYSVKVKCVNPSNCAFTVSVTSSNVLLMNGGWLGTKIQAIPNPNSLLVSILPPNCPPDYFTTPQYALDLVTDNLDITTGSCDSDTCVLFVDSWKTLKKLNNFTTSKCGGAGGGVAATTVSAIDAPIEITLRKNSAGKWQLQTLDTVKCDSCYLFNFQVTCGGKTYFQQELICFNYTGPALGCRQGEDILDQFPLSIFPNPASNECSIQLWLEEPSGVSISMYNSIGELVSQGNSYVELDAGLNEVSLSVNHLSTGMYVVEVRAGDMTKRVKLLKF